jgi:hypothetical protein
MSTEEKRVQNKEGKAENTCEVAKGVSCPSKSSKGAKEVDDEELVVPEGGSLWKPLSLTEKDSSGCLRRSFASLMDTVVA